MEEQYIPYGQDLVDVQEMNKLLADNVEPYLSSKRWSPEQKNKWRLAYGDLMSRGILGISTDGGRYSIEHNGVPFVDTEGYYGDVANFITTNLSSIAKKKEEEKKVELPKYNLDLDFTSYFMNQYYGGTGESNFENFQNTWSNLDKADKYGIRGTNIRRGRLKNALKNYITYLDENKDKYNYDNGVFKNLDDLKGRLNAAIHAMDTEDLQDDIDTLNALGIRPDFLDTGANRIVTLTDGTLMTASLYRDLDLKQQEQTKLAANKQAQANQFKKVRFISAKNFNGTPPTGLNVLEKLNGYYSLGNLNGQQLSELIGAFKFAERNNALEPLSKEELTAFGSFRGANRLRKIDGLNGFYWDSAGLRIVQPFMNSTDGVQSFLDLVNLNDPKVLLEKINNTPRGLGTELTSADYRDISATLLDLGALVSPGILSGTIASLGAAGARTWNRVSEKGLFNGMLNWDNALDWGTAILGGTPLWGDATSFAKFARGFGKLMTIPAVINAFNNVPEAKAAFAKIDKNNIIESLKKLTPADYHAIASVLTGVVGGRNYLRGNLSERRVLKESGINVESKSKIREYSNKFGLTRTKPQDQKVVSTLKVKKTGEDGKVDEKTIELTEKLKIAIQKAKPSEVEKVAKDAGVEIPEGYKIEINRSKINTAKSLYLRPLGKANSEVIGNLTKAVSRGEDKFNDFLKDRSYWNKLVYGSNNNLRQIREKIGIKSVSQLENSNNSNNLLLTNLQSTNQRSNNQSSLNIPHSKNEIRSDWRNTIERGLFTTNEIEAGSYTITNPKNSKLNVEIKVSEKDIDGFRTLSINGSTPIKIKNQRLLLERIAKAMKSYRSITNNSSAKAGLNHKEIGKILQDLKRKGWLKQGGKLTTEDIINNYFKNKLI